MIIAIDGPAGSGKSTVARNLAEELGFMYLDTGAMYRAITLKALENKSQLDSEDAIVKMCEETKLELFPEAKKPIKVYLDGRDVTLDIRTVRITQHVSDIAKIKGVRKHMLKLQRSIGKANDSVIEGRDIGTVVFPDADKKFFLDADFSERAERRCKELKQAGKCVTLKEVQKDLSNRDCIDSTRDHAPLKKAEDAVCIDTTHLTIEQVVSALLTEIKRR